MLHIKFDQDWPTGFRDIKVQKCGIFVTQGQVTPNWVVWFGPKSNATELLCLSWLPATLMMIRLKLNELAWRHHFPIISLWDFFFRRSRAANSVVSGPIWPKFELIRDFMSSLPANIKRIGSKAIEKRWRHNFPHQDWPTGFRDIQVWKCGRRRTDDGPLVYYKFTFWAGVS